MKQEYNWWTDPKNAEEVKRISWWEHDENKTTISIPISVIHSESGHWVAGTNSETEQIIGKNLGVSSSGDTKEEAIKNLIGLIRSAYEYSDECVTKYQRWVPFRKGNWKQIGGTWFVVFGLHFYFRYGKGMKGGWYIPFTKQNISFHSEWEKLTQ